MPFILRFVKKYKHLGGWLNAANNFVGELAYRGALMTQAMHPIKKKFLHVENIPMREKNHVVGALVLSRGLHTAGAWPTLNTGEHHKLEGSLSKVFR